MAGLGRVRLGLAGRGEVGSGVAGLGAARQGEAGLGAAWQGRLGAAWQGGARRGMAGPFHSEGEKLTRASPLRSLGDILDAPTIDRILTAASCTVPSAKPCLDCGRAQTVGARCDPCRRSRVRQRSRERGTRTEQGYTNDWLRLRDMVLMRDLWRCYYCGAPATTADHLIPKACGGLSLPENLVAACLSCNSSKKDRTADEFIASRGRGGSNL